MILSGKNYTRHFFDVESSDAAFEHAPQGFDIETFLRASKSESFSAHPYAKVHSRSRLLQLWGSNLTPFQGWIKPGEESYLNAAGGRTFYQTSEFSRELHARAARAGVFSETESVDRFYSSLNSSMLRSNKPVALSGWNMGYDLSAIEAAAHRHDSLHGWRGFFARSHAAGQLHLIDSSEGFIQAAWKYGQHNPAFAHRFYGGASTAADLRQIPGWGVENVAEAMGGARKLLPGFQPHLAHLDAKLTAKVVDKFASVHHLLSQGHDFDSAMRGAGVVGAEGTAESFFSTVFAAAKQNLTEPVIPAVPEPARSNRFAIGLGVGVAGLLAWQLATSTRRSRQTQITGLSETGTAADRRHRSTDFGSGYRGISDDEHPLVSLHTAAVVSAGAALYGAHRYALNNYYETYGKKLHSFAVAFEERSPHRQFRTFRLAEVFSRYVPEEIKYSHSQLVSNGSLTPLGSTIKRLSGDQVDVLAATEGLHLVRNGETNGYLKLKGYKDVKFSFTSGGVEGSTTGGAARRYRAPLGEHGKTRWRVGDQYFGEVQKTDESWWHFRRRTMNPSKAKLRAGAPGAGSFTTEFHPTFSRVGTEAEGIEGLVNRATSAYHNAGVVGLEMGERFQHLMSQMGVGLRQGSYNKLWHIPFVGEGGLINEMLLRRVVPAYLGYTGLKYADYLLGHHPSHFLATLPLKARVLHAELTDHVPGARRVTDSYKHIVPGPQFGALALPVGGAFLGGLIHYSKVLTGTPRKSLPLLEKEAWAKNLPRLIHEFPTPAAIGLLAGAALAVPFIPGMLGDRKTADERRRIYSGEELVPVRQGRFWEMGPTPWQGGRIKYFRQHWAVNMQAHAEDASLYGSEKEKWAHHPLLHPLRYLHDPYYLERRHYEDRPYPVTSPAFSDVPLIGPMLAATIGKFIKPVVSMHADEWKPGDDYQLFGPRLEPRGARVDSVFEARMREHMAAHGYAVRTQEPILNYRADFAIYTEGGRKIAIEADGESYHRFWREKRDKKREAAIRKEGWEVLHVRSSDFMGDPNAAMDPVYRYLDKRGVSRMPAGGRDIPSGLAGLSAPVPEEEFSSIKHIGRHEAHLLADMVGMPGFIGKSLWEKFFPNRDLGKETVLQGSRQMTSASRRYYEKELGAMAGPNPSLDQIEPYGYSEGIRRFIQPEHELRQVNPLRNRMPSWMPGAEYMVNFHQGDPYVSIPEGYMRLPGEGYAALHPELKGIDPEKYPAINKFEILADVAPYSKQFQKYRDVMRRMGSKDTGIQIEFDRVMDRVKQVRDSGVEMKKRRFTDETETIAGTIHSADDRGFTLEELPGRRFSYSSVGTSAADLAAAALGENNRLTRAGVVRDVQDRKARLQKLVSDVLAPGKSVKLTVASGVREHATNSAAVVVADGINVNRELIGKGLGREREDLGGAESRAMYGAGARALGKYAEGLSFTGDEGALNPLRYLPQPYNSKLWQNRTAISQYEQREMYGTPMRRWHRPIHDFLEPYLRGTIRRATGKATVPAEVQFKRDLNTLADTLKYLRGVVGGYTNETRRSSVGANLFSTPDLLASGLSDHEAGYFRNFLGETDSKKRKRILSDVSPELARALTTQWVAKDAEVLRADGKKVPTLGEGGRIFTAKGLKEYRKAKTQLDYGDYERSQEIADFFARTGFRLPDASSEAFSENLDYTDVKAKVIQQEGYDLHDFNIFDDRASQLWRKPYLDGTVRELTSGDHRSTEVLRQAVEQMMVSARDKSPRVRASKQASHSSRSNIRVTYDVDRQDQILKDARRNPDKYRDDAA